MFDDLLRSRKSYRRALPPPGGPCKKPIDLLFILDSSERVTFQNWLKAINATGEIAKKFEVNSTRFGVIQYNSNAEVPLPLTKFKDFNKLSKKINSIFYKTGGTRTDIAVAKADEVFRSAFGRKATKV